MSALGIFVFAKSALAQHKEDPISPRESVPTEKREPVVQHKEDPISPFQPQTEKRERVVQHKEDPISLREPRTDKRERAPQPGPTEGRPLVFDASHPDARLEVHYEDGWRVLCEHPCEGRAFFGEYRVTGDGLITSRTFSIYPNPGTLSMRANVTSDGALALGIAMTVTGAIALLVGLGAGTVASLEKREISPAGVASLTGGLVLLPLGILRIATAKTTLSFGTW